jgi:hypothetical protein
VNAEPEIAPSRWLLLFHQIPPTPAYLRVKIGRRLARIGALSLKNTVYVLPATEGTLEDFQWVLREVVECGGEATLCEARFVEGLGDTEVERRFQDARDEDYAALAEDARKVADAAPHGVLPEDPERAKLEADSARFERRLEELASIDFFHAPGREAAAASIASLRARLRDRPSEPSAEPVDLIAASQGKVWVTRTGVHVDRIASAWLIRHFIDPAARFKFVSPRGYRPEPNELRFDMFEAEFTHEGELCTFEVLVRRFQLGAPGLREVGEIIHDIDLKVEHFERPETAGVAALVAGLCLSYRSDEERLEHGFALFEQLRAHFGRKRKTA